MVPVTSASETQDAAENRRARLFALIAVGEVGVIAALFLLDRLLHRARARLRLRAQHPRHPARRLLRRHHRHRPDHAAHRRRVRPLGRLRRRPLRRGLRQADDRHRPACPDRAPGRPRHRRARRSRQRPRRGAPAHSGLHPDARHALHRPRPDPGRDQRRARSIRCRPRWAPSAWQTLSSASAGASSSSSSPRSSPTSSSAGPSSGATCTRPAATPRSPASSASTPTATRSAPSSWWALAAIAGMFVMADLASGTTSIGSGWELSVIAGVVVGGSAFSAARARSRGAWSPSVV